MAMYSVTLAMLLALTFSNVVHSEDKTDIPFGTTLYTVKEVHGLKDAEKNEWSEAAKAVLVPGAVALKIKNEEPNYTISVGGIKLEMKHGVMLPFKFLKREANGTCTIDKQSINCLNSLENGRVAQLQLEFKGDEVILTRTTEKNIVRLNLQKLPLEQSGRAIEEAASDEVVTGRIGARHCSFTGFVKVFLC